jgi:hypothetical protein
MRADDLEARLQKRTEEPEQERRLSPLPPVVIGGALVVPAGLLARLGGGRRGEPDFSVTSANYDLGELLSRGEEPS